MWRKSSFPLNEKCAYLISAGLIRIGSWSSLDDFFVLPIRINPSTIQVVESLISCIIKIDSVYSQRPEWDAMHFLFQLNRSIRTLTVLWISSRDSGRKWASFVLSFWVFCPYEKILTIDVLYLGMIRCLLCMCKDDNMWMWLNSQEMSLESKRVWLSINIKQSAFWI